MAAGCGGFSPPPAGIEWHKDEVIKQVKAGCALSIQMFENMSDDIFEDATLRQEARGIMKTVDKRRYYIISNYKHKLTEELKRHMPPMKGKQMEGIIKEAAVKLQSLLQCWASQSVQENFTKLLDAMAAETRKEWHRALISGLLSGLMSLLKSTGGWLSFGLYDPWNVEDSIAETFSESVRESDLRTRCSARFEAILREQQDFIVQGLQDGSILLPTDKKEEAKPQPEEELPISFVKAKNHAPWSGVLWYDKNIKNPENQTYLPTLKERFQDLAFTTDDMQAAIDHIEKNPLTAFTVITAGDGGEALTERIKQSWNVKRIVVFCMNFEYHRKWAAKHSTDLVNIEVTTTISALIEELSAVKEQPAQCFLSVDDFNKRIQRAVTISMLSQLQDVAMGFDLKDCLKELQCQREAGNKPQGNESDSEIVDMAKKLQGTDEDCMELWTGESFCYQLTQSMRDARHDERLLKICTIAACVGEHVLNLSKTPIKYDGMLYRGLKIFDQDTFDSYANSQGLLVFFREFLATSQKRSVAEGFASAAPMQVILEINARDIPKDVVSPIQIHQWSQVPDEMEVLFPLFSLFHVTKAHKTSDTSLILEVAYKGAVIHASAACIYSFL
eukprot:TRINITY_DN3783_c0_g1_i1.p1 TRINITY_DN3783_c0_g1~~TRINITY_DN3783_c0_g1_i1.p1  ORF type:complete len:638 (-),score=105.08 TRINITY_DN3783_c0_g1_i1:135-1982(-)